MVGGMGPKIGVLADTRFSRLILSRAGLTAVRDKINLEKWVLVRVAQIRVAPEEPVDGSGDCRHAKSASGGLLARKHSLRGQFLSPAGDGWRLQAARRPLRCRLLPSVSTRSHCSSSRTRSPTRSPTPVARVELARSERCGPIQTVAPGCTGG